MLSPHELKQGFRFSKSFHGYSPAEVDEQLSFVMEQYSELYRANDELEKKLNIALAQIDGYRGDETSIQKALLGAQRAAEAIVTDAEERAKDLEEAANESCRKLIAQSADRIRQQYRILADLERRSSLLRSALLSRMAQEMEAIHALPADGGEDDLDKGDRDVLNEILGEMREQVLQKKQEETPPLMEPEEAELPDGILSMAEEAGNGTEEA